MKSHHRIFWDKGLWISGFESKLYLFLEEETRIGNTISHFDEVFDG